MSIIGNSADGVVHYHGTVLVEHRTPKLADNDLLTDARRSGLALILAARATIALLVVEPNGLSQFVNCRLVVETLSSTLLYLPKVPLYFMDYVKVGAGGVRKIALEWDKVDAKAPEWPAVIVTLRKYVAVDFEDDEGLGRADTSGVG